MSSIPQAPYGRWDLALGEWLWVTQGLCPITTDERSSEIEFILPSGVEEAVVRNGLTYSGTGQLTIRFVHQKEFTRVYATIPKGRAGEQADLRLAGPLGPGGSAVDMGFHLTRVESARVVSEIQLGDGPWETLEGVRLVAPQPLKLRIRFAGDVDQAELRTLLTGAFGSAPHQLEAPSPGTIVAVLPEPPALITLNPWRLNSPYGHVLGDSFRLYVSDPPTLLALDPATGQERVIGTAPTDIWTGSLAPNGGWATLSVTSPTDCMDSKIWVMNLATGQSRDTPLHHWVSLDAIAWTEDRLAVAAGPKVNFFHLTTGTMETREVASRLWGEASPDGRYLLGYIEHYDRERPDWYAPITVLVHDLETGEDRTFHDVAWVWVPHKGVPPSTRLFWTPDGKGILINDPLGADPLVGGTAVLHLDPVTGERSPYSLPDPDRSAWRQGPGGFSYRPQGWFAPGWGPVRVRDASGVEHQFGEGLVLGWAPDGALILVRWDNEGLPHCEGE